MFTDNVTPHKTSEVQLEVGNDNALLLGLRLGASTTLGGVLLAYTDPGRLIWSHSFANLDILREHGR